MAELTPPAVSPEAFERAQDIWQSRMEHLAKVRWNWQVFALLLGLTNLSLALGVLWLIEESGPIPFAISEDERGELAGWGPIDRLVVEDVHLIHALTTWVERARGVVRDADVQQLWINRTYARVSRSAAATLNAYYETHNPYERGGKKELVVTVEVKTVQRVAGRSWQIRWKETERGRMGETVTHHQAIVEIRLQDPETVEELMANPTGLFIETLSWTKEAGA